MATILYLVEVGRLYKLDPMLEPRQQEDRLFYASQQLVEWLENMLPELSSTWNIEESPAQQLDALFEHYASGGELVYGTMFKALAPVGDGVWMLKTADVRIFGWFPHFDCFIGVVADSADRIKRHNLYPGYKSTVIRFRDQLDLDEPKFISGDQPHEVVSNFAFS